MANKTTLKDIAQKIGVSQNTVSLALRGKDGISESTRQTILQVAKEMNYVFKEKKSKNICIISTISSSNDSYYFSRFLAGIEQKLLQYNCNIFSINNIETYSCDVLQDFCHTNTIHGIITLGKVDKDIISKMQSSGMPIVCAGYYPDNVIADSVLEDNLVGIMGAMAELHNRGYKNFGFIGGSLNDQGFWERYMAFLGCIHTFHVNYNPDWIITDRQIDTLCNVSELSQILQQIGSLPEVFICANDQIGMSALKSIHLLGLQCPNDIGIVGFDNCDLARLTTPVLATIDNSMKQQITLAIQRLFTRMENPNEPHLKILIPTTFIEGESIRQQNS